MTKLEKKLSKALFGMTVLYAGTVIATIRHIERQMKYDAKIKEGLEDIQRVLNKHKYAEVYQEEA